MNINLTTSNVTIMWRKNYCPIMTEFDITPYLTNLSVLHKDVTLDHAIMILSHNHHHFGH